MVYRRAADAAPRQAQATRREPTIAKRLDAAPKNPPRAEGRRRLFRRGWERATLDLRSPPPCRQRRCRAALLHENFLNYRDFRLDGT